MITFTIPGKPVPKGRPRFGKGRVYTPRATVRAEKAIGWAYKAAGGKMHHEPVWVELRFTESGTDIRIGEHEGDVKVLRGDLDNYIKLALDALNGIAWEDDKQVVTVTATKR